MYLAYDILWIVLLVLASPYLLLLALLGRQRVKDRLGWPDLGPRAPSGESPIWIHAASVGEIAVVASLAPQLKELRPETPLAVSTTTTTGLDRARQMVKEADFLFVAPLDAPCCVRRVFRKLSPTALLLVETELWPNLIRWAKRTHCRVGVVNGRLTDRGFPRYRRVRPLVSRVVSQIDHVCAQSDGARARFEALGVRPDRIAVTGNVKADLLRTDYKPQETQAARRDLRMRPEARIVVAGCTRDGEEAVLLDGLAELRARFPDVVLVLAPRHLGRVGQIERELRRRGLSHGRRSLMGPEPFGGTVLLLDTMGELSRVYAAGDAAFVGASLVAIGGRGHNPLEPAALGVPVLFGPYMQHDGFKELLESGAAQVIDDSHSFAEKVARLLEDPHERSRRSAAALKVVRDARGASQRTTERLREHGII